MKKTLSLILAAILVLTCFAACGSSESAGSKGVKVVEINLTDEEYAFGIDKTQPELLEKANAFIAEIKANGKFDEICNNYFGDGTPVAVKSATPDASKDQLVVATNAEFEPFEYMEGSDFYGIDMEIAAAFAESLGKELVISNMDFDAVCLAVGQQKCDVAMAGLTIKPEREEYVSFTDSYYVASQNLVCLADNEEFAACTSAADVEAILAAKDANTKVGFQTGTTGQFYSEGDEEWGFAGFPVTSVGYKNGALAVQDLINGNLDYVIIDSAPAACITATFNAMQ